MDGMIADELTRFTLWLATAKRGESFTYYTGYLGEATGHPRGASDAEKARAHTMADFARAVMRTAGYEFVVDRNRYPYWAKRHTPHVTLVQKRLGERHYEYIAQRL